MWWVPCPAAHTHTHTDTQACDTCHCCRVRPCLMLMCHADACAVVSTCSCCCCGGPMEHQLSCLCVCWVDVKRVPQAQRTTIIIRDLPADATEEEVGASLCHCVPHRLCPLGVPLWCRCASVCNGSVPYFTALPPISPHFMDAFPCRCCLFVAASRSALWQRPLPAPVLAQGQHLPGHVVSRRLPACPPNLPLCPRPPSPNPRSVNFSCFFVRPT